MATMTLAQLRAAAQNRADMAVSSFISDSEWTEMINASLAELHGLIVQSFGEDYFLTTADLSYAAGATTASVPADFFKIRGVDVLVSSGTPNRYATLRQFNWNTRNAWTSPGMVDMGVVSGWWSNLRYRVYQGSLLLTPPPGSAITVRLWYIPVVTVLSAESDTTATNDSLNGWLEYVIVDAAIKAKDKQESDTTTLQRQKAALIARIEGETANRDAGDAETIRDVNATGNSGWGMFGGGGW